STLSMHDQDMQCYQREHITHLHHLQVDDELSFQSSAPQRRWPRHWSPDVGPSDLYRLNRRGSRWCSRAASTCRRPSCVRACNAKISRMTSVRSNTRTLSELSRLRCCRGLRSSLHTSMSNAPSSTISRNVSTLPAPMKCEGSISARRCRSV